MSQHSRTFLSQVQKFNKSSFVEMLTQITFLAYYLMLGFYAIINILLLTQALHLRPVVQIAIAVGCTLSAIMNEYIDMMVTVERDSHDEVVGAEARQRTKKNLAYLPLFLLVSFTSTSLALGHYFLTTYNMIWLQLSEFPLSRLLENSYYTVFIGSALVGFGLTYINSFFKYINHVLLPGHLPKQGTTVASRQAKPAKPSEKSQKKNDASPKTWYTRLFSTFTNACNHFITTTQFACSALLNAYLTNPIVTAVGAITGAALYGLGDFSQMYGLLYYLNISNIVVIAPHYAIGLSIAFAANTILERNGIWGYNFNHYVDMHASENKNLKKGVKSNLFIQAIKFDHSIRRFLANARLAGVFTLNVLGAFLHFKGGLRLLGMATSAGYYVSQRAQVHFQTRKGKDAVVSESIKPDAKEQPNILKPISPENERLLDDKVANRVV
ncbi:MAG: hypothetical protein VX112_01575 [Pseudomonadota bacterium]|nr:hypothetical protein [Pseudomonadota bacterium]